jgi:hypothetical protein
MSNVGGSCNSSTSPCARFTNTSGPGVGGYSRGTAAAGYNLGAVEGHADAINGTYAFSKNRDSGYFENENANYYALYGQADVPGAYPFAAINTSSRGGGFTVDARGNGYFSGTVDATAYNMHLRINGGDVRAFDAVSTRATIEDTGTTRLANGQGVVRFDSALAHAIDIRQGYQVFLTPDGDTRGLYVAAKYEDGFIVRETEHGRSSIFFDYRIVAHPVGSTAERLPTVIEPSFSRTNPGHVPQ